MPRSTQPLHRPTSTPCGHGGSSEGRRPAQLLVALLHAGPSIRSLASFVFSRWYSWDHWGSGFKYVVHASAYRIMLVLSALAAITFTASLALHACHPPPPSAHRRWHHRQHCYLRRTRGIIGHCRSNRQSGADTLKASTVISTANVFAHDHQARHLPAAGSKGVPPHESASAKSAPGPAISTFSSSHV